MKKIEIILIIFMVFILLSCKNKNNKIEKSIFDNFTERQNTTISNENNPKEEETFYKRYFINEVWQCNLPLSSSEAIKLGYTIEREEKAENTDNPFDWTYFGRMGYDSSITCVNNKNEIEYWENDKNVKIFTFLSIDSELQFLNYNFIGKNIEQIKKDIGIGIPTKKENILEYDNIDFHFILYLENNLCIKIEYIYDI